MPSWTQIIQSILLQCSHATLGLYEKYGVKNSNIFEAWEQKGKPITIYKVSDTETLVALQKAAKVKNLMTYLVHDAGRTQIASGSRTVLAIGPDSDDTLQGIVGYLPLYWCYKRKPIFLCTLCSYGNKFHVFVYKFSN